MQPAQRTLAGAAQIALNVEKITASVGKYNSLTPSSSVQSMIGRHLS